MLYQLNSSLDDIDIRYNAVSGKPEWRERGAGSFVPFSSGVVKSMVLVAPSSNGYKKGFYTNEDGTFGGATNLTVNNTNTCTYVTFSNNFDAASFQYTQAGSGNNLYYNGTVKKAGYFINQANYTSDALVAKYYNVGDTILSALWNNGISMVIYFGETNPFE